MNGISVMRFAQAPCGNGYGGRYDRNEGDRYSQEIVREKCIRISLKNLPESRADAQRREGAGGRKKACGQRSSAAKAEAGRGRSRRAGSSFRGEQGATGRGSAGAVSARMLRLLILALLFSAMLAGFRMMTSASNLDRAETWKYYTTVTLGYGEDLTDVVYRYCDREEYASAEEYLREVCSINSIPYKRGTVPELRAGTQIVVPYYSAEYR